MRAPNAVRPTRLRAGYVGVGLACLFAAALLGVLTGPVHLAPADVVRALVDKLPLVALPSRLSSRDAAILWELRVPRVALAGLVGATLAVAGTAYQGVFRNPLADPYLLGVAAGAGLGATVAVVAVPAGASWPVDPLPLCAFAGALVAVGVTYALGTAARGATSLVLAGVAVASFFTAAQTYLQQRDADTLRRVYSWILGALVAADWREVALVAPYALASWIVLLLHRRVLDVLSVGDDEANSLGLRAARVRAVVVLAATLGTAAAVAAGGLIGFVGIIVPHAIRLTAGASYRILVPLSLLLGAAFLILTDLAARTVVAPAELPIGVITALFGAPFFAVVLRTARSTR